jgi:hypothetical protein
MMRQDHWGNLALNQTQPSVCFFDPQAASVIIGESILSLVPHDFYSIVVVRALFMSNPNSKGHW